MIGKMDWKEGLQGWIIFVQIFAVGYFIGWVIQLVLAFKFGI